MEKSLHFRNISYLVSNSKTSLTLYFATSRHYESKDSWLSTWCFPTSFGHRAVGTQLERLGLMNMSYVSGFLCPRYHNLQDSYFIFLKVLHTSLSSTHSPCWLRLNRSSPLVPLVMVFHWGWSVYIWKWVEECHRPPGRLNCFAVSQTVLNMKDYFASLWYEIVNKKLKRFLIAILPVEHDFCTYDSYILSLWWFMSCAKRYHPVSPMDHMTYV